MTDGDTTWFYTYDGNGMRTSRTNGTKTYNYVYNGSQLVQMTVGNDTLYFTYGALGPTTVTWNGETYFYALNAQGDVVGIFDNSGYAVVTYNWDNAWGYNPMPEGLMASTIGTLNPLRYRGYVYDQETGYYYLQSRYYDPEIGRFINADGLVATGQGLLGNNMFAYCLNNPVNSADKAGESSDDFWGWLGEQVGVFIYEWITGEDHPQHQVQEVENQIRTQQTEQLATAVEYVYTSSVEHYQRQENSNLQVRQAQIKTIKDVLESNEYQSVVNSNEYTAFSGARKMTSAVDNIKKGAGLLFVPCPTIAEDLLGVGLITYGIIKGTFGLAEFIIGIRGES